MRPFGQTFGTRNGSGDTGPRLRMHRGRFRLRTPSRRAFAVGVLALAGLLWVTTLFIESGDEREELAAAARALLATRDSAASDALLEIDTGPDEQDELSIAVIPGAADGWVVQGPQPVPGTAGSRVEAFFNPIDDERKIDTPLVVYVQVTRVASALDATVEPARRADERYPAGRATVAVDGVPAEVGHTDDLRIYYLGWAEGDLVYTVEATFTNVVPAQRPLELLSSSAEEVAGLVLGGGGTVSRAE